MYELRLNKGQFLKVTIASQNVLPILTLTNADGKDLISHGFMKLPVNGKMLFQIEQTGTYKIAIKNEVDLEETLGYYELSASVIAQPDANDFAYAKALLLQDQFWPLLSKDTPESLTELLKVANEALVLWRSQGERQFEANALTFIADAYQAREQFDPALENFKQALTIIREFGTPSRIAGALIPIGQVYAARSDYPHALTYYLEALPLFDEKKYPNMVGWNNVNIGHVYSAYGELAKGLEYYQRAYVCYDQYKGIPDEKHFGMGVALGGTASIYLALGEKQKAIDNLKNSLEQFKVGHSPRDENLAYSKLGEIYTSLGEYGQAEGYLEKATQYFRQAGTIYEARVLSVQGSFYQAKSDYQKALESLQAALKIRRSLGDRRGQAQSLTSIGAVYAWQSQPQNALHSYTEAQTLWQEIGDKYSAGRTLNYLGLAYYELKDAVQARDYFNQALTLRRLTNDREGEANTLYNLARLDFAAENFKAARPQIEAALAITESVRATVDSEELRASYLATVKDYYEFYVDLLMQLHRREAAAGHDGEALQASEMAHARSLIETLANTRRQLRQGVAPVLLKRELELQQRLNAKAEYQRKIIGNKAKPELLSAAGQEIQALTVELQELRTTIQSNSPHYAELAQARPLTVREIQQTLLDENTILLSYTLGKDRSYLWAVSQDSLNSYELPKGEIIEAAARRVYELLLAKDGETTAINQALSELSQLVLAPLTGKLGQKRLLIVADGALQYII